MHNRLNWLLVAVPITLFFEFQRNVEMTFLFSMIAIMPLAFLMGHATEEIALRAGENLGGLLNATFGNAVEIIIWACSLDGCSTCRSSGNHDLLVQASLIGSILGNLLLVLILALLWGGCKHRTQTFNQALNERKLRFGSPRVDHSSCCIAYWCRFQHSQSLTICFLSSL